MRDDIGFIILVNGTHRTFRDVKAHALDAARLLKAKKEKVVVEILDRSTGQKMVILEDGRVA